MNDGCSGGGKAGRWRFECLEGVKEERKGEEWKEWKASRREYKRPISIPSTNLSLTARSTVLTVSLTASGTTFLATKEVEKALGAKARLALLADVMVFLVRNDILL